MAKMTTKQILTGIKDWCTTKYRVVGEALSRLNASDEGLVSRFTQAQNSENARRPLESSVAGAPSANNVPKNWNEEYWGVWQGAPRFTGQQYIDKASKKLYMCLCQPTNSTGDWTIMN